MPNAKVCPYLPLYSLIERAEVRSILVQFLSRTSALNQVISLLWYYDF